ncbi:MAG: hypothetical protein Q7T83_08625 [Thermodesulfovibrionales bacterium]|nr:hypothetical protein [Thermodesulfovibrionales bacterium]
MELLLIRSRIILVLMLLILLPAVASAGFREQRLAVIPPGYQLDHRNIVFTPDGKSVAYGVKSGRELW